MALMKCSKVSRWVDENASSKPSNSPPGVYMTMNACAGVLQSIVRCLLPASWPAGGSGAKRGRQRGTNLGRLLDSATSAPTRARAAASASACARSSASATITTSRPSTSSSRASVCAAICRSIGLALRHERQPLEVRRHVSSAILPDRQGHNAGDVVAAPAGTDPALVRNGLTCAVNLTNPAERCIPYPTLDTATPSAAICPGTSSTTSSAKSRATRSTTRPCTAPSSTARCSRCRPGSAGRVRRRASSCRDRGHAGSEQHRGQSVQPHERHADARRGQRLRGVHRAGSADREGRDR